MDTYGNTGNEGHRGYGDGNGDVNTSGNRVNEPSRNRDIININIVVHPDNESPVSMQANLEWTLDELHSSSAEKCDMVSSQCHSSCDGLPLVGPRKVRETRIKNDSTVTLYEGEGTPTPGVIKNEPSKHKVQIIVEKPDGRAEYMDVDLSWSQDFLADEIAAKFKMDKRQFFLLFGSKQLGGKGILLDAGIRNDSRVRVNLRLRGGSQ